MTFRSRKLLDLARDIPVCMACGSANRDDVVMAHSNLLADGRGIGHKSSDAAVAALCYRCHTWYDNPPPGAPPKRQRHKDLWLPAHIKTLRWLVENGRLVPA